MNIFIKVFSFWFIFLFLFYAYGTINENMVSSLNNEYHESAEDIEAKTSSGTWLLNKGKLEFKPWSKIASKFTYYDTGSNKYGASTYIPSYIDSILFRKEISKF